MAPRGTIQNHPERVTIEMARMAGVPLDKCAERFGVSRDAIWRHMSKLPEGYKSALLSDIPREELAKRAAEEDGLLLDHFKLVRTVVEGQLIAARACGDHAAVAKLTQAAIAANEAVGRLTGDIKRLGGTTVNVNNNVFAFTQQPQWQALATGLLDVANLFPQAKTHILALVRRVEAMPAPSDAPMIEGTAHAA